MNLRMGVFCVVGGLFFTAPALSTGHFGWWWLAGLITAASLLPVVRFGPRNITAQFGEVVLVLVVVGLVCTLSEALIFTSTARPEIVNEGIGGASLYVVVAALVVALAWALKLTDSAEVPVIRRSAGMTAVYVLLAGASYVVYYEIFGGITYQFFTKQYYPHAAEQVAALGGWFIVYQWARGILMTLAVLPVIDTLRMPRWQTAAAVGILLWVVGGAAPLLTPNIHMVASQRYIHIVEIMTQNVSLGLTAAWLLRPRAKAPAAGMQPA